MTKFPLQPAAVKIVAHLQGANDALSDHFSGRPLLGPCPPAFRVPVYLKGYFSREFRDERDMGDGFEIVVEQIQTVISGKEDSLEAFDVLLERTAKSYEGTARNHDIAPMFRALADRFHTLLAMERMKYAVDLSHVQALNWMKADPCRELMFAYPNEEGEPGFWAVFERRGNRNDREWWLWGKGDTPINAIIDAAERQDRGEKPYPERTS